MIDKLKEKLSQVNDVSKKIIKYGILLWSFLLLVSVMLLYTASDSYVIFVSRELLKTSFTVLLEVFLGAAIIDCGNTKVS